MSRLLGAVLLVTGFTLMGIGAQQRMHGRIKDLNGLICGLESMQRGLASREESLLSMLCGASNCTQGRPAGFFRALQSGLIALDGNSFARLWNETLIGSGLFCEGEDLEILGQLGGVLGCCDGESQLAALGEAIGALTTARKEAKEQSQTKGRVYVTLGVSCGLLLVILLI